MQQIRINKNMYPPEISDGYLNLELVFQLWEKKNLVDVILTE